MRSFWTQFGQTKVLVKCKFPENFTLCLRKRWVCVGAPLSLTCKFQCFAELWCQLSWPLGYRYLMCEYTCFEIHFSKVLFIYLYVKLFLKEKKRMSALLNRSAGYVKGTVKALYTTLLAQRFICWNIFHRLCLQNADATSTEGILLSNLRTRRRNQTDINRELADPPNDDNCTLVNVKSYPPPTLFMSK